RIDHQQAQFLLLFVQDVEFAVQHERRREEETVVEITLAAGAADFPDELAAIEVDGLKPIVIERLAEHTARAAGNGPAESLSGSVGRDLEILDSVNTAAVRAKAAEGGVLKEGPWADAIGNVLLEPLGERADGLRLLQHL